MSNNNIVSMKTAILIILSSVLLMITIAGGGLYIVFNHTNIFNDDVEVVSEEVTKAETGLESEIVYPEEVSKILYDLEFLTNIHSSYCEMISTHWYNSISNGEDINVGIQKALKEIEKLNAEAENNIINDTEKEMKQTLELIVNPPTEYEKAYDLVVEAYGHYINLYNLSKNPKGNYQMFVENYTSSESEVENNIKKITTMYRHIYIGTSDLLKRK